MVVVAATAIWSADAAEHSLQRQIDDVVRKGLDSQLPAHLSQVLGVSTLNQSTPVKQSVMREASTVRTFNVSTANHDDVVLMSYDEAKHSMKAYLVSPAGQLRMAVKYQAGAPPDVRSPASARSDFAKEIKFWTELAHQAPGTK